MPKNTPNTPLTPAVLHILLALATEERHGYGIMKEVESDSGGKVKMGPGTLYGSLNRMMDAGLIRESDKKIDPELDDERRVYYQMTALGQATLAAELERYREVVAIARKRQLATQVVVSNQWKFWTALTPALSPKEREFIVQHLGVAHGL